MWLINADKKCPYKKTLGKRWKKESIKLHLASNIQEKHTHARVHAQSSRQLSAFACWHKSLNSLSTRWLKYWLICDNDKEKYQRWENTDIHTGIIKKIIRHRLVWKTSSWPTVSLSLSHSLTHTHIDTESEFFGMLPHSQTCKPQLCSCTAPLRTKGVMTRHAAGSGQLITWVH